MKDTFFMRQAPHKRKKTTQGQPTSKTKKKTFESKDLYKKQDNDEIHSDSSDVASDASGDSGSEDVSDTIEETVAEKKVRLAKEYLALVKEEDEDEGDNDGQEDTVASRIRREHLENVGKVDRRIATQYASDVCPIKVCQYRGHQLAATCVAVTTNGEHAFTASKDGSIVKWEVSSGKRLARVKGLHKSRKSQSKQARALKGHPGHVLALALSSDSQFLATGGHGGQIWLWNASDLKPITRFSGHRSDITALAFQQNSHTLFSGSQDRTLKLWSVDEQAYVETLYGHQDCVSAIDSLTRERAVSVGGRDRTLRLWKIQQDSQLVFNGHVGHTETVKMVNENMFVSGGEDGTLNLWTIFKKKPVHSVLAAHALQVDCNDNVTSNSLPPPPVTAVACVRHTDLVASGSCTGYVKLWVITQAKQLQPIQSIAVAGYINGLAFNDSGTVLVAATGQEHRLGRWEKIREARNGLCVLDLSAAEHTDGDQIGESESVATNEELGGKSTEERDDDENQGESGEDESDEDESDEDESDEDESKDADV